MWSEMPSFHQHSPEAECRLVAEWAEAVRRDRDHPCVVAWVPANESFGLRAPSDDGLTASFLIELYRLTHELDDTRPVVSNDGWEHALSDICTLHDYGPGGDLAARYRTLTSSLEPSGRPFPPYLPGFGYRGEPVMVSEFGGVALATDEGWGYSEVRDTEDFVRTYSEMVLALMSDGPVEGFCYTQLTDIEQERNGLLTFDRRPKVDPATLSRLTRTPKKRVSSKG